MGDAFMRALAALENGQGLPLEAPQGVANCTRGRIRMGIFFDGTGNNMWTDLRREQRQNGRPLPQGNRQNGATNVVYLYLKYGPRQSPVLDKAYHHGVGTDYDENDNEIHVDASLDPTMGQTMDGQTKSQTSDRKGNTRGTARGHGGKARIEWGLRMLAEFYSYDHNPDASEKYFDVFGFSRGAALARDFANQVRTQRVANLKKEIPNSQFRLFKPDEIAGLDDKFYECFSPDQITPKFMGIYDTVSMFGFETGTFMLDVDHTYVEYCVHFIAEDEFRTQFPVTSLFMDPNSDPSKPRRRGDSPADPNYQEPRDYAKWFSEMWYPGCHSDIGGSYLDRTGPSRDDQKKGDIKFITLWDMWRGMKRAKVPVETVDQPTGECIRLYRSYCDFRSSKDWATHKEQPNSQYIHSFRTEDFMVRFYGPTPAPVMPMYDMSMAMGGMPGVGMYQPPPPPPPNPAWANIVPRVSDPSYQALRRTYIHDSQSEMVADHPILFSLSPRADDEGNLPRLQRTVLKSGAQPKYSTTVKVRPHHLPPQGR